MTNLDKELEAKCRTIIDLLSEEDKEEAAKSSYYYLRLCSDGNMPSAETREKYAMKMAMRHLVAEDGNADSALAKMKSSIQYRKDMNIDVIRLCFEKNIESIEDPKVKKLYEYYRNGLEKEMKVGKLFVRGQCHQGRPLGIVITRLYTSGFDEEWFMNYNIYNLERAIAIAERISDGKNEKVIQMFDFASYSNKLRPPFKLNKDIIHCLQNHYPERVEKVILVDAPFLARALHTLMKPFMDPVTKKKILFVTGDAQKLELMTKIISDDQAMPFMLPGGKLTSQIDMERYLYEIPFDHGYTDP